MELPVNIMVDILTRLPTESVLESKLVCKNWRDVVRHPSFSQKHLNLLYSAHDSGNLGFLFTNYTDFDSKQFYYVECNENSETPISNPRERGTVSATKRFEKKTQERIAEMMDNGSDVDDQWCDDEYSSEASEFDREGKIRHNQFHTIGYHEGLSKGQEAAAQEGFTNGFKESVSVGYKWGLVRGVSSALACLPDGLKEKLVESLEAREKFQMLYTSISSVSKEDALGLYRDEVLHDQSKEHSKAAEENSSSETLSSDHISRCSRLRGYSEELEFLLQSSAIQVHSAVE